MSLRIYLWLVVVTCSWFFTNSQHSTEIKLIRSYVEQQKSPTNVVFFTCWNSKSKVKALEEISKSKIPAAVTANFSKIAEIKRSPHTLMVSDNACKEFNSLLATANELNLFRAPSRWLILSENSNVHNKISSHNEILMDSNFVVATKTSDKSYHLKLMYKNGPNDNGFLFNDLGIFSGGNGFSYYNQYTVSRNRSDMMGANVTAGYVITQPEYFIDVFNYRYRQIDIPCKANYILYIPLFEMLNASSSFIQRDSWGYKAPNATLYQSGMFADVQNGSIDIACASFYTVERMKMVEYISVASPAPLTFVLKAPPLSHVHNVFLLSLEKTVWYCLFSVSGLTIMVLYLIIISESKFEKRLKKRSTVQDIQPRFSDVILVQISAFTQQGSDTEPRTFSGRIALFISLLIMMFLYTAYAANILVFLQSTTDSIKTVGDLLYSKIELGVEDTVYNRYYFQNQHDPIRKAIYDQKIAIKGQKPNFMNATEGVKRMRTEFFAFHIEQSAAYKEVMDTYQEHEKCGLTAIDYFNVIWPSISVRKNSSYREHIKVGFRKMHEFGIISRHNNRVFIRKPQCVNRGGSFVNVGWIEVYFPFMIFGVGLVVAVCLLIAELLLQKYEQTAVKK